MVAETDTKSGTGIAEAPAPAANEAPAPQTPQTEAPKPEPPVDWKAVSEKERAARVKLEGDYRALSGARRKQEERDAVMERILEGQEGINKTISVLGRALASGDHENVPGELEKIQAQTRQVLSTRQYETAKEDLINQFYEAVNDEDGKPLLDIQKSPELDPARTAWLAANDTQDLVGMARAVAQVERIARQEERRRLKQEKEAASKAVRTEVEKALEEAEVNNLDTGAPSGGGGMGDVKFMGRYALGLESDHARAAKIRSNLKG